MWDWLSSWNTQTTLPRSNARANTRSQTTVTTVTTTTTTVALAVALASRNNVAVAPASCTPAKERRVAGTPASAARKRKVVALACYSPIESPLAREAASAAPLQFEIHRKCNESQQSWIYLKQELFWYTSDLCGKAVRESFRRESIDEADTFLVAYYLKPSRTTRHHLGGYNRHYVGVVNLKEDPIEQRIYVDLICASKEVPGLGTQLMQQVEQYAKRFRNKKFTHLQLSSLAYVINFYRKLGFQNTMSADGIESKEIATKFQQLVRSMQQNTHNNSKTTKRALESIRFDDDDAAQAHPQFRQLLNLLIKDGLMKNKTGCNVDQCNVDGYIMTKALQSATSKKQSRTLYKATRSKR